MTKTDPKTPKAPADAAAPPAGSKNGRIGVLIVNLGTPDATDYQSMRRYLKEFLSDPRVIEENSLLWKLVFNGVILTVRPRIRGRAYDMIWNREKNESPLKTVTRAQAEKLARTLAEVDQRLVADWAMRYGHPSIALRLGTLVDKGCDRILLLPLYPQYAAASTATVCDEAFRVLMTMRRQPTLRVVPPYYDDAVYIESVAASVQTALAKLSFEPEVILASFHGIPRDYATKGDPYPLQCEETTRLLRAKLGFDDNKLMLTFQSRFGRAEWLQPYTDETVKSLARSGVQNLAVVTPGFAADCLETLEEIAVENAHIFKHHGGKNFAAIPCLNDSELGMAVIGHLAQRELQGWL
jgi:protoporphyrin/coproporphyrin ferrochelatase